MVYRSVETSLWSDPRVRSLDPHGRYLFLYLITNPHSHVGGIYYLPVSLMAIETGLSDRVLESRLDTLSGSGIAQFDRQKEVVWVVNMFRYQARGQKNEISVANHLKTLHDSDLIDEFLIRYPNVTQHINRPVRAKRESIPTRLRFKVLERDAYTCQYCGRSAPDVLLEVDHIVPVAEGGADDEGNLRASCGDCNRGKSDTLSQVGLQEQEQEIEQEQEQKKEKETVSEATPPRPAAPHRNGVAAVFARFKEHGHDRSRLSESRKKLISARLRDGYTVDDLKLAIDGLHLSKWHTENGNLTVEYGLRNADKIDKLMAVAADERHPDRMGRPDLAPATDRALGAVERFARRHADG